MTTRIGHRGGTPAPESGPQGGSAAPYLDAWCTAHRRPLPGCDHCASTPVMAQWAGSLAGGELAAAIEAIASRRFWYAGSERQAILAEAARRLRQPDPVTRVLATGDIIEFREAGPGSDPDASAVVEEIDEYGGVRLRFPSGDVMGYLPGVIQFAVTYDRAITKRS